MRFHVGAVDVRPVLSRFEDFAGLLRHETDDGFDSLRAPKGAGRPLATPISWPG
jgi:hypothetical protein